MRTKLRVLAVTGAVVVLAAAGVVGRATAGTGAAGGVVTGADQPAYPAAAPSAFPAAPVAAAQPIAGGLATGWPVPAASTAPGTVTVSGIGTVQGTPDSLQLVLDVVAASPSVSQALDGDSALVAQVTAALEHTGVAGKDIATANLSLQQEMGPQGPQGYQADRTVTAALRDLGAAGGQVAAAVHAAGNASRVDSFGLNLLDNAGLLAAARARAFADARARRRSTRGSPGGT